jgi:hypothetical protein
MRSLVLLVCLLWTGAPAWAAPLKIKNGSPVRVSLHGQREAGIGVRPLRGAWTLELSGVAGEVADIVDVTDGAVTTRWAVSVSERELVLDNERFIAGHAYRVKLRHGTASALVYLYPPLRTATSFVGFGDDETHGANDGDGIATTPKGEL